MSLASEWMRRLRGRNSRFDGDLEDEIGFHIEARTAELEQSGLHRREARLQARREFGSTALAGEESRAAWQFRWLSDLAADLRHGLRAFRRSPAFTLTAILSLALGIGATSAIFTALDAVLWRPIPVKDPNRLVHFSITRGHLAPETDLPAAFARQLADSGIFAGVIFNLGDGLSFSYDDRAERIIGEMVSPNFFSILGVQPILGQGFTPEARSGRWVPEAVLSYGFWKRRFGGDPAILGRTIRLNTVPFTIVGVSPPSFSGLVRATDYELRIPLLPAGQNNSHIEQINGRPDRWLSAVARLKPGAGIAQAEAAADAQLQEFLRTTTFKRFQNAKLQHLRLSPASRGYDEYVLSFHTPLYVLLVLVAVVLLIACSNVANMLLARATARSRELAVRTSIGAGRLRLIRQMLAESLLLAALGGALGLAVAYWAADVLFHFLPQGHINLAVDLHPDGRALLFTSVVSLLTGLLFGLAPALQATSGDLGSALKADSAASTGAGRGSRSRRLLIVLQVAFSMVLLMAAGVFARTLANLRPTGYRSNPDRVLLFTMKPPSENYNAERRLMLTTELIRRVSALPGVQTAAFAENGPLGSRTGTDTVQASSQNTIRVDSDSVGPGFLDTVGIARVAGRDFTGADQPGSPLVAIVNQALARTLFPNQNPLGRTLRIPLGKWDGTYQIVGVAADVHYYDIHRAPPPFVWLCMAQISPYMPTLHVRTNTADTAAAVAAVRHEFDLLDKGFPVFNIRTMAVRIEDSLASERMVANLSGTFGVLALVLAAVGLYGILAYSVSRRTREIGLRMALGSSTPSVLWMVAREALVLIAVGSAAGVAISAIAWRFLSSTVPDVSPIGAPVLAACAGMMLMIGLAAITVPAIRACRIDPLIALRHE